VISCSLPSDVVDIIADHLQGNTIVLSRLQVVGSMDQKAPFPLCNIQQSSSRLTRHFRTQLFISYVRHPQSIAAVQNPRPSDKRSELAVRNRRKGQAVPRGVTECDH
jgi:hypothetical protein